MASEIIDRCAAKIDRLLDDAGAAYLPFSVRRKIVLAVLKEIREPTNEMVRASWNDNGAAMWRAMIDEAMRDGS